jgi:putative endonuclease
MSIYHVYVLTDENGKLYKGLTNNLERRIKEHRRGKTKTTKRMKNIVLAYHEKYDNFLEARKRELYFKTAAGRRFIKTKLKGD